MTFEMTCSSPCDTPSDDSLDTVTDEELMQSWHLHRCQRCFEAWAMRVWKDPGYKAVASRVQVNWEKIDVSELRQKAIYELWDRPREIRFVKSYFRRCYCGLLTGRMKLERGISQHLERRMTRF